MKVVKAKDGYMIDVLADEAPVAKKRKPKAKPKYKTNIQFITDLMSHSQQGALMQAYLIEAIHAYSKQTKVAPPWSTDNTFISEAAWRACADEAMEAINNRSK
jgi:hypothetical protein